CGKCQSSNQKKKSRPSRETKYDLGYAFQAVKCTDVARLGKYNLNLRRLSSFLHTRKFTVDASSGSSCRNSWEGTPSVLGSVLAEVRVEGRRMRDFGIDVAWQALLKVLNPLYETTASYSHLVANKITISHVPMSHPGCVNAIVASAFQFIEYTLSSGVHILKYK
ncbi:hypothetical protein Tco_0086538, partial [Tanacetum coccineum]